MSTYFENCITELTFSNRYISTTTWLAYLKLFLLRFFYCSGRISISKLLYVIKVKDSSGGLEKITELGNQCKRFNQNRLKQVICPCNFFLHIWQNCNIVFKFYNTDVKSASFHKHGGISLDKSWTSAIT